MTLNVINKRREEDDTWNEIKLNFAAQCHNTVSMTYHRLRLMLLCQKESNKNESGVNNVLSMRDNLTCRMK
ncbi:CLUMA_CG021442, isoform A [Clunio marinus]|uniref:CLUMA_CG021442, isoform A n=1 Tax=Clunio marinus TaxID=568069 RepID=A0A1J1J7M9_9DIPT|nr:CLUMA_CG021442, isoform A [Clunio marinus]